MTQDVAPIARVLIADDDPTMSGFCARALAGAGWNTTTASDAATALHALRQQGPFDLLLADIQMPGLSGLELAQLAREIDPAMAVVIMTGHSSIDTLHASVRRGVADYLTKPFALEELTNVVAQALHKRQQLQESLRLRALEELVRSSEAINALLDRNQLARAIISRARQHVPCQICFLILAGSPDTPTEVLGEPASARLLDAGREAVAESFRAGRPIAIRGEQPLAALDDQDCHQGLAVPLRAHGEAIGALLLCDMRPSIASVGAQEILALLAHQAGNALHNAQLYGQLDAAYRGLRELDRTKSEFIAIASHELRSPLAIVIGYANMVRDRSEGEPREYAQRVLDGAERIKTIFDDMQRLHDFDRNQSALQLEATAIAELVQQALERQAPAAQQKQQRLTLNLPETPLIVSLDREKALQVIGNLLHNAVKFTPVGGQIAITVKRWAHPELVAAVGRASSNPTVRRLSGTMPAAWVVLQIADDGIGLPRDQQQRIFERFYQVASSLTREQGGVGLGLSIACDLTTLQGGVIWVESEVGQGSTFSFALPLTAV